MKQVPSFQVQQSQQPQELPPPPPPPPLFPQQQQQQQQHPQMNQAPGLLRGKGYPPNFVSNVKMAFPPNPQRQNIQPLYQQFPTQDYTNNTVVPGGMSRMQPNPQQKQSMPMMAPAGYSRYQGQPPMGVVNIQQKQFKPHLKYTPYPSNLAQGNQYQPQMKGMTNNNVNVPISKLGPKLPPSNYNIF